MSGLTTASCSVEIPAGSPPKWIHLVPAGTFTGRDGRGPYTVRNAQTVIDATKKRAGTTDLPLDYDHQTETAKQSAGTAIAAGWIKDYEARADGIWGQVEWTPRAQAALQAREYRYLSPVFLYDGKTGDVSALMSAALTNTPNLNLTALASQAAGDGETLSRIRALLGLAEGTTSADIVGAVTELTGLHTAMQSLETTFATMFPDLSGKSGKTTATSTHAAQPASPVGRLTTMRDALIVQRVEQAVRAGQVPPAMRDVSVAICSHDPKLFDDFATAMAPTFKSLFTSPFANHGKGVGMPHPVMHSVAGGNSLTTQQAAVCARMGLSPEAFSKIKKD
jgi:phage I-like protein